MSYYSAGPVSPYANPVSLPPGGGSYPQTPNPQTTGYTGYSPPATPPPSPGPPSNLPLPPTSMLPASVPPAQDAGLSASGLLNRETELDQLGTVENAIRQQRITTISSEEQTNMATVQAVANQAATGALTFEGSLDTLVKEGEGNVAKTV
jgi:hypothetical protein